MIVKLYLYLFAAAVIGFFVAIAEQQLLLTNLAGQTTQLASLLLLSAFGLFMLTALAQIGRLTLASLCAYFSYSWRNERKLMFYINKHNHLSRRFQLQKHRLLYDNQQQRKRLLRQYGGRSARNEII